MVTKKKTVEIPTIDVALVVIRTGTTDDGTEYAVNTSNQVAVTPQTETTDAIKLVKNGRLIAQKPATTTITGHQLVLTDTVFTPELAKVCQGGKLEGSGDSLVYTPPVAGSDEKGEVFEVDLYSAQYDASGKIVRYEVTTFPNCQGTPFGITRADDTFSTHEYTINSAPENGKAPYKMSYVTELPTGFEESEYAAASVMMMSADTQENKSSAPAVMSEGTTEVKTM